MENWGGLGRGLPKFKSPLWPEVHRVSLGLLGLSNPPHNCFSLMAPEFLATFHMTWDVEQPLKILFLSLGCFYFSTHLGKQRGRMLACRLIWRMYWNHILHYQPTHKRSTSLKNVLETVVISRNRNIFGAGVHPGPCSSKCSLKCSFWGTGLTGTAGGRIGRLQWGGENLWKIPPGDWIQES